MADRGNRLKKAKDKMNRVEDELFGDFCRAIGVDNIRQYEERELAVSILELDENIDTCKYLWPNSDY